MPTTEITCSLILALDLFLYSQIFHLTKITSHQVFFNREFLFMTSVLDDNTLSLDQDTNRFLV